MASATSLMSNPSSALQPTPPPGTQLPSSNSSSSSDNGLNANSFLTLLTAQLQAQDPLNPMDPSQMVDQLTQINSLQQLIQIQSDLQTIVGSPSTTTQSGAQASASQTNSSQSSPLANNQ
jgi:flagellar basal-body rod modification protein FlgD